MDGAPGGGGGGVTTEELRTIHPCTQAMRPSWRRGVLTLGPGKEVMVVEAEVVGRARTSNTATSTWPRRDGLVIIQYSEKKRNSIIANL